MCGIFCAVSLSGRFKDYHLKLFKESTDIVRHRGPNAYGYKTFTFSKNENNEHFNIFFGHRRLSIIDLSEDGNQPMEDDGVTIIFNGEIFNYIELREELKKQNVFFNSESDTEVILKIYKKYGPQGFKRLNGMWAFILYDSVNRKLIVCRDRFSIKPLFWVKNNDEIYFASEIKQLLGFLPRISIDKETMSLFLSQGLLDINVKTFFNGVEKLEPKIYMTIDLMTGKISKEKYWDYELQTINEPEMLEFFFNLLTDCVRIRLRSDVNLGALLSGGLDSSAISMLAHNSIGEKFKTFTVISDQKKFNEAKFVDIIVNAGKIRNEKYLVSSNKIKENFNEVIRCQDEPFSNFVVMSHYTILQKIKQESDITVILSGQGGDEVLMGYLRFFFLYIKNLYSARKYFTLSKEIIASLLQRTVLTQFTISAAKRYLPNLAQGEKVFLTNSPKFENTWDFSDLVKYQMRDIDKYSVPILTRYEDRNSMAHSLEIRLPFLDHRLVEFLLSIDISMKIKNGWNKYILRKSFTEMPDEIRWRRDKKGFSLPEEIWLKKDFKEDIINSFNGSVLEREGLIRENDFLKYYESYLSGNKRIHHFDISRVYIAEKWARSYIGN